MTSDKFVHRLVLPSVRLSDAGDYTAVAGSSMSKGHLTVEGRDVKITEPVSREVTVGSYFLTLKCSLNLSGSFSFKLSVNILSVISFPTQCLSC